VPANTFDALLDTALDRLAGLQRRFEPGNSLRALLCRQLICAIFTLLTLAAVPVAGSKPPNTRTLPQTLIVDSLHRAKEITARAVMLPARAHPKRMLTAAGSASEAD
jgi:hypothetical protein